MQFREMEALEFSMSESQNEDHLDSREFYRALVPNDNFFIRVQSKVCNLYFIFILILAN